MTVDESGQASSARDLSPAGSDALLRGLAVTSHGGLVAAWSTTIQDQPSALYAASRGRPMGQIAALPQSEGAVDPDGGWSHDA